MTTISSYKHTWHMREYIEFPDWKSGWLFYPSAEGLRILEREGR